MKINTKALGVLAQLFTFLFITACGAPGYHVAKTGKDSNSGTARSPFLTISKAAEVAQPGDQIYVHEGTYREYINPTVSGTAEQPIVFEAMNDKVYVKGSEVVKDWEQLSDGTWKAVVNNAVFGDYNPFALVVTGDFQLYGQERHREKST